MTKGSSRGSRSFFGRTNPNKKPYVFIGNTKLAEETVSARLKRRRTELEAIPREEREVFDMEIELPGITAPNEPLPQTGEDDELDDKDWVDDEDPDEDNQVFVHCLSDTVPKSGASQDTRRQRDYGARLEAERAHWEEQEGALTMAYMQWKINGQELEKPGEGVDYFTCKIISLEGSELKDIYYKMDELASVALMRAGYVATAPLVPSIAFTIDLLELYRVLNKHHRRLGLQPFMRAVYDWQGSARLTASAYALSKAYDCYQTDCYQTVRHEAEHRVNWALGRTGPDARLTHSCPACFYKLEGEAELPYDFLCAADGNMSLRRFSKVGTADTAVFDSSYFLDQESIAQFANVVQARSKPAKRSGKVRDANGAEEEGNNQDADLEVPDDHTGGLDPQAEEGHLPQSFDPLEEKFSGLVSDCVERWKANADDQTKVMWDCFDECGVFVTVCRHGLVLIACDIVRSGEQSKYPLALLSKLQEVFPGAKLVGYDIGCSFKHTAQRGVPGLCARFVIPSMHGYAHNRSCQLSHHPKYMDGTGMEDFEVCERFFSLSNNCAGITRYTTAYHRRQILDTHFRDSDEARKLAIGKFIYNNYRDALTRISKITETFQTLELVDLVEKGTFADYLREEREALFSLSLEPLEEQAQFNYITALNKYWEKQAAWNTEINKAGLFPGTLVGLSTPLPPKVQSALVEYNEASAVAGQLESYLKIPCRWEPDSVEYQQAVEAANERKWRQSLDRLQRLVIQRLFELQKANLVSTGYKMRVQIAKHLKTRSRTIRSALDTYNKAAKALNPPRQTIKHSELMDMAFLSQFDLLCYSRRGADLRGKPWADPATRILTDKYFELLRAKEEIVRLNIEWRRMKTWLVDERALYIRAIKSLRASGDHLLADTVQQRWKEVQGMHQVISHWLERTQELSKFSGDSSRGCAVNPEKVNPELQSTIADTTGEVDDDLNAATAAREDDSLDDPHHDGQLSGLLGNATQELNLLIETIGRMTT